MSVSAGVLKPVLQPGPGFLNADKNALSRRGRALALQFYTLLRIWNYLLLSTFFFKSCRLRWDRLGAEILSLILTLVTS